MRKGLIQAIAVSSLGCVLLATAGRAEGKIGDESDGSRAMPVHLIPLFDEEIPELDKKSYKILRDDEVWQPFSMRETCGKCHTYEAISHGWHFNAADANVDPGRVGQPWIFVDSAAGIQIPVSYRSWAGTFKPSEVGLSHWEFVWHFGGHTPGGGPGEMLDETEAPEEIVRTMVSGKLEINCLACHSAAAGQNQSEYALQLGWQNYRWAATAACEFGSVSGAAVDLDDDYDYLLSKAIKVDYHRDAFDHKNRVLFDIVREPANERCYFCHSNFDLDDQDPEKWKSDEDVHLAAGLRCVDCHRNGLDHNIVRGYEGEEAVSRNPLASTTTCKGCHLGGEPRGERGEGRFGAPRPRHAGIPAIHFEKLTCTACHSSLWPGQKSRRTKTSRAHALGTLGVNKSAEALPHVITPVFARGAEGRIGPNKLIWPAFWGVLKEGEVTALDLETVRQVTAEVIGKKRASRSGDWVGLTKEQIGKALSLLSKESAEGQAVYIAGGRLHRLDDSGNLLDEKNAAAEPYLWPIAHDVRPAGQSLGVRSCGDCHATDAPFFFGDVEVDSPVADDGPAVRKMVDFQQLGPFYVKAFAFSFVFRPWLKLVILASCAGLASVLVLYGLRVLAHVVKVLSEENS